MNQFFHALRAVFSGHNPADAIPERLPSPSQPSAMCGFWQMGVLACVLAFQIPVAKADATEDFFKAAEMDNADQIRSLLQQGMSPNVTDKYRGNTGLIVALLEGSMRVFDTLVNAPGIDIEARASNSNNALMIAAYRGNEPAFDILLKKGAAINRSGWTPLHYAAAGGKNKIVQILLERGADIDARSPNHTTPVMVAAYEGHFYTVKLLLERGADVTLQNDLGMETADFTKRLNRTDISDLVNEHKKKTGIQQKITVE